jgi:hypothetical protein
MPYVAGDFLADGQLFLTNAQSRSEYIYEIKSDVTRETIDPIILYFVNLQQRLPGEARSLLITHQLADYVVDRLVEKEIEFIDATGNIFLNSPGNYVLVRRPLRRPGSIVATDITSSTIQLMYLILRDPAVLAQEKAEHQLAALSGMAIGTIKTHLNRLEKLGYLQFRTKQKRYRLIDYIKLFERWEIGYAEVLRPELFVGTFTKVESSSSVPLAGEINHPLQACRKFMNSPDTWGAEHLGLSSKLKYSAPEPEILPIRSCPDIKYYRLAGVVGVSVGKGVGLAMGVDRMVLAVLVSIGETVGAILRFDHSDAAFRVATRPL